MRQVLTPAQMRGMEAEMMERCRIPALCSWSMRLPGWQGLCWACCRGKAV